MKTYSLEPEMQRDPSILADFHLWWQLCLLRHGLVEFEYWVDFGQKENNQ